MAEKIIFLDIDGPLIPSSMFVNKDGTLNSTASKNRDFSPTACAVLNYLCRKTNAKIVFNSAHNYDISNGRELKNDVISRGGILPEHIHPVFRTEYYPASNNGLTKKDAILKWLETNGKKDTLWASLDDDKIMQSKNFVHVDFDAGITFATLNRVYRIFGIKDTLIV